MRDVEDWATGSSLASLAAYRTRPMAISRQGDAQNLLGMQVTPEFLPALGVKPVMGRMF